MKFLKSSRPSAGSKMVSKSEASATIDDDHADCVNDKKQRKSDQFQFIERWVKKPGNIGAVAPSSRALSECMASQIATDTQLPIIELGPGTGPVTAAILARGIDPALLTVIEYDENFCALLKKKYPLINVVQGDAYAHADNMKRLDIDKAAHVVSSLPLLSRPTADRSKVITEAMESLVPSGLFIQFSYGPNAPWKPGAASGIVVQKSKWVKLNIPPARVWTYSQS